MILLKKIKMKTAINLYYVMAASFTAYFFISYAYKLIRVRNVEEALQSKYGLYLINLKHTIGIVLFGTLYYLVAPEFKYLIGSLELSNLIVWALGVLVLLLSGSLAYNSAKKKIKSLENKSDFKFNLSLVYFPVRLIFLLSYEFFFRGIIFFSLLKDFDLYQAIVITTVLYVIIHGFDSRNEIIGAIPFGIVLCLFSYYTTSVWFAFVIHATLSVVYELSIFKHLTTKKRKS